MRVPACLSCLGPVRTGRRGTIPGRLISSLADRSITKSLIRGAFASAVLVCHAAFASSPVTATTDAPRPDKTHQAAPSSAIRGQDVSFTKASVDPGSSEEADLTLSPAALRVSRIADRNGDRHFIMVDKARGKIMVFENGRPTFSRPALTGESLADQLPPDARSKPLAQQIGVKYKVTPAGRFTLTRAHDEVLGDTFDINELEGKDWRIAIHRVWLGNRSQHRDARLLSANDQDKHVTEGCIDVDPGTIVQLFRLLPNSGKTAIYILPIDESLIATLF
jgi:hypothetical protein